MQRFSPVVYSRRQHGGRFEHLLYTYIESGIPLLVTLPRHVVVAHGHSSDYSTVPTIGPGEFVDSSIFNRALIISDDNCHPYQGLHQMGPTERGESQYYWSDVEEFIVPLPERAFLSAEDAQKAIERVLHDPETGIAKNSSELMKRPMVMRTFLTSTRSFKRSFRRRGMGHGEVEQLYRRLPMPHFVWICEIADRDEYCGSKHILGEVIWDATRNAHEPDGWIALHYPERLFFDVGAALNRPHFVQSIGLTGSKSYSLFDSNLHTL